MSESVPEPEVVESEVIYEDSEPEGGEEIPAEVVDTFTYKDYVQTMLLMQGVPSQVIDEAVAAVVREDIDPNSRKTLEEWVSTGVDPIPADVLARIFAEADALDVSDETPVDEPATDV